MGDERKPGHIRSEAVRNVGIVAHIDAGKTTLTERILYACGAIRTMGEVQDGTTVSDYLPEERERGISITAAAVTCEWKDLQINVVDTPGHIDFSAEVERSLCVMDGIVVVVCAVKGVQAQSETVWRRATRYGLPALAFINKMDREGARAEEVVAQLRERFRIEPVPVQYAVYDGQEYLGTVDLLEGRASFPESAGLRVMESEGFRQARENLVERLAEFDDSILQDFLDGREPKVDALRKALRRGTVERKILPVLFGSSLHNQGVTEVLDAIGACLPAPCERRKAVAGNRMLVFKVMDLGDGRGHLAFTRVLGGEVAPGQPLWNIRDGSAYTVREVLRVQACELRTLPSAGVGDIVALSGDWGAKLRTGDVLADADAPLEPNRMEFPQPVVSLTVEAEAAEDAARLGRALKEACREDPTLHARPLVGSQAWTISGLGELHLQIVRDRLRTEKSLRTRAGQPRVEYRQTVTRHARRKHRFERNLPNGLHLEAEVELDVTPLARGEGLRLEAAPQVRALPPVLRKAVLQGILNVVNAEASGFPLTDARVAVLQATAHAGEADEAALLSAARDAAEELLSDAEVQELEPVMRLEVNAPQEALGGIIADLNARRGNVLKVESQPLGLARIDALVPLAELFGYASSLRSLSAGRGEVVAEPAQYQARATH